MSSICWNFRGLGDPQTVREVLALEMKVKPMFIFLMETKVRRDPAERLRMKLNFDGLFYVDVGGLGGGLALFWREMGVASLISYSKNHIDVHVPLPGSDPWKLTCFYGFPERSRRQQSWDLLRSLQSKSDLPWQVADDFNDIATPNEKRGQHPQPTSLISGFNYMLEDCGFIDLDVITYDHSAIHIEIKGPSIARQRRKFMFENAWLKETGCKDIVLGAWNASVGDIVPSRLNICGASLKSWGGSFTKRTEKEIAHLQSRLNDLREKCDANSLNLFRDVYGRLHELYDQLNIFWRQRAKTYWLMKGDTKGVCMDNMLRDFVPKISVADNNNLLWPFIVGDVKDALFSMDPDKSPGPDGFSPAFFQYFWSEIGDDVARFIIDCTKGSQFPEGMNDAIITLILKRTVPTTMGELRPIALCNVIYKILSKMLANRLKEILEKIISPSQSVFLSGSLITDNVFVASEVIHYLNRKRGGRDGWCALKLDIAKAYRVSVNGELSDFIVPSCGLRQGDPLSPYLFILCAEGLSHLLSSAMQRGVISPYIVVRRAPRISHLFFVDNSLLCFKATVAETNAIKSCLTCYERISCQVVNYGKSCIIYSKNTETVRRNDVVVVSNVEQAGNIWKYLGLPIGIRRNKREVFSIIETKLNQHLGGWRKKILSRAGKEVLLKSVAQALPTYTMSIYFLPGEIPKEKSCSSSFTNTNSGESSSKENSSGSLEENPILVVLVKVQRKIVLEVHRGEKFSCSSSLKEGQEVFQCGYFKRIGNGADMNVWNQPWLPNDENSFIQTPIQNHGENMNVNDLILNDTHDYNVELLNSLFDNRDVELIMKIPVSCNFEDHWCWKGDLRGLYFVSRGYRLLSGEVAGGNRNGAWQAIWRLKIPPNIRNFLWRYLHGVVPTLVGLPKRRVEVDTVSMKNLVVGSQIVCWIVTSRWLLNEWHDLDETVAPSDTQHMATPEVMTIIPNDGVAVYVDATVFPASGHASYGIIIHDCMGNYVEAKNCNLYCN
ncbi:PREDICTED: uncharacterized protein LOC109170987 [Ipomoea nil]|uniref:uncharacterized protein LOC109170987 n=1 Tax=Ipomoea nil TaxID=35883 RepID=UPI000901B348|nr:PREDICTED: uncharacterized protein LOC109170987 [Ipomoea nil]